MALETRVNSPGSYLFPVDRTYWALLLLVTSIIVLPIWMVDHPGMVDFPNHLARCYVLAHYYANPVWQSRYWIDHTPLPNLAIDLIVVPLNRVLPIVLCGKLFLTLAALLYVLGCVWLGYASTGKRSWLALIAAFTFYNSTLLYGFVNYAFGVAVFLCALAFWLQSRHAMTWWRFSLCGVLSIAAFLSHLSAVVFLGVSCVAIAMVEFRKQRNFLLLGRQLLWLGFPLIIMVSFMKRSGQVGRVEWGTFTGKIIHLFTPILSYSLTFDVISFGILCACTIVLARKSTINVLWIASLLLFFLFLISPDGLFQSSAVDDRYVLPATLLGFLSIQPRWACAQKIAIGVALLLMVVRTGTIAANWRTIDRNEQQVLAMADFLPRDASVYVMPHAAVRVPTKQDRALFHVVTLWTISREAYVSTLFSTPGMQPLVAREPPHCLDVQWLTCVGKFDYIWTDDPLPATDTAVRSVADPVVASGPLTLWKVKSASRDYSSSLRE